MQLKCCILTISAYGALVNATFEERRGIWVKADPDAAPLQVPTNLRAFDIEGPSDLVNFESE